MNYVVTNIRLAEDDYFALKEEAARKRMSLSAIIREKVGKKRVPQQDYAKLLLSLKTDWFTKKDYKEYKRQRAQIKKRVKRYNW